MGQGLDERVCVGGARRVHELGARGVGIAETQVVLDGAVKQISVLVHDRELSAKRGEAELTHVAAPHQDPTFVGFVKPQQQAHDRRLAAARRSDDPDPLALLGAEAQPVVGGAAATGIGEDHVLEFHRGRKRHGARVRGLGVADCRLRIEDLGHAHRRRLAEHSFVQDHAENREAAGRPRSPASG